MRPSGGSGSGCGRAGAAIAGRVSRISPEPLRGPRTALQIADHLADGAGSGGHHGGVEHEGRQLSRRQPSGEHVVAADPQDHADATEHEQDHQRHERGALADAAARGRERRFHPLAEQAAIGRLVAIRLHGADFVERLVQVAAEIRNPVLAGTRELADAPAEQSDGGDHHRHHQQNQSGQLEAGECQHHQAADPEQRVAHCHRHTGADHLFEQGAVRSQARNHLARAGFLEERRRQLEQMGQHVAAQIGHHALAQPGHQVEACPHRRRHDHDHRQRGKQGLVEGGWITLCKARIDHAFQTLTDDQEAGRRDHQRQQRDCNPSAVRAQVTPQQGELVQSAARGGNRFGHGPVSSPVADKQPGPDAGTPRTTREPRTAGESGDKRCGGKRIESQQSLGTLRMNG